MTTPAPQKSWTVGRVLKWIAIGFAVLLLVGMCATALSDEEDVAATEEETTVVEETEEVTTSTPEPVVQGESASREVTPEPEPEAAAEPTVEDVPREHQNALRSARQYLNYTAFSHQGLIDQLEFENYSTEAARYAANTVDADWNQQALQKGEQYLDYTSFSPQGLVEQLMFDGFSAEQAQ